MSDIGMNNVVLIRTNLVPGRAPLVLVGCIFFLIKKKEKIKELTWSGEGSSSPLRAGPLRAGPRGLVRDCGGGGAPGSGLVGLINVLVS